MDGNSPTVTFRIPQLYLSAMDEVIKELEKIPPYKGWMNRSQYILRAITTQLDTDQKNQRELEAIREKERAAAKKSKKKAK